MNGAETYRSGINILAKIGGPYRCVSKINNLFQSNTTRGSSGLVLSNK
jgi:hypothetical protein